MAEAYVKHVAAPFGVMTTCGCGTAAAATGLPAASAPSSPPRTTPTAKTIAIRIIHSPSNEQFERRTSAAECVGAGEEGHPISGNLASTFFRM
jgi:hypothetical protein